MAQGKQVERVVALRRAGTSTAAIRAKTGMGEAKILDIVRAHAPELTRLHKAPTRDEAWFERMVTEGATRMAREEGLSQTYVRKQYRDARGEGVFATRRRRLDAVAARGWVLREEGADWAEVARLFAEEVPWKTWKSTLGPRGVVERWAKRHGRNVRKTRLATCMDRLDRVAAHRRSGLTWRQVAEAEGYRSKEAARQAWRSWRERQAQVPGLDAGDAAWALKVAGHGCEAVAKEEGGTRRDVSSRFQGLMGSTVQQWRRDELDRVAPEMLDARARGAKWAELGRRYRAALPWLETLWQGTGAKAAEHELTRWGKRNGQAVRHGRMGTDPERKHRVQAMRAEGRSWKDIAQAEGYSSSGSARASHAGVAGGTHDTAA